MAKVESFKIIEVDEISNNSNVFIIDSRRCVVFEPELGTGSLYEYIILMEKNHQKEEEI